MISDNIPGPETFVRLSKRVLVTGMLILKDEQWKEKQAIISMDFIDSRQPKEYNCYGKGPIR